MKRTILLSMLLVGFGLSAQRSTAQDTQPAQTAQTERDNANPRHELSLTGGYGIVSGLDYDVLGGDNKLKSGFRAGLGYTWFFHRNWGLGTGLEYARYNNLITLPEGMHYATPSASTEANTTANFIVNTSGFREKQGLSMLQIPLTLQWNAPANRSVRIYALAGGKIGLPINMSYSQSASRLSTEWLHINDADRSGRVENGAGRDKYSASGDFNLKPSYMLTAELGAKFRLGDRMWLYAGGYIDYGLNDVRNADNTTNLTADVRQNTPGASNSILAMRSATSSARTLGYGLTVRLGLGWGKKKPAPAPVPAPVPAPAPAPEPKPEPAPKPEPVREVPQEIKQAMIDLSNILFAFDKFNLNDAAIVELDKVTAWLLKNPELPVEIGGHTDNYGTDEYNQRLSENRAKSVLDYFVSKGVAPSRISSRGYGELEPVDTNATTEGRQKNRRVELTIKDDRTNTTIKSNTL